MKIYVASSWRNTVQPGLVARLREKGHEVYDFKNPNGAGPNTGFGWQQIDPNWRTWTPEQYRTALTHAIAQKGFESDERGMVRADACVLLLPSGRSAHVEFGWMVGRGQLGYVLLDQTFEPELMYLVTPLTRICTSEKELFEKIAADDERLRNDELRDEYNLHTLKTVKHRWRGAAPAGPQNLPKPSPVGGEIVIEGGTCNLPVPGQPLLVHLWTVNRPFSGNPQPDASYEAVGVVTGQSVYAGTFDYVRACLAADGYVEIDPDLRSQLDCLKTIDPHASVFIHEARFKAAREYGKTSKDQADAAFASIKHLLP